MVLPQYFEESDVREVVDVLCGRGGDSINKIPGNQQFRMFVNLFRDQYCNSAKKEKMRISARIVAMVHETGGRYMVFDGISQRWVETSDRKAMEKTSQALREQRSGVSDKFTTPGSLEEYTRRFQSLLDNPKVLKRTLNLLRDRETFTDDTPIELSNSFEFVSKEVTGRSKSNNKRRSSSIASSSFVGGGSASKVEAQASRKSSSRHSSSKEKKKKSKRKRTDPKYKQPEPEWIFTTMDGNRPIRALRLRDSDGSSSTSSSDEFDDGLEQLRQIRVQRTKIRLTKKQHRSALYNFDMDLPETDSDESVPIYGASHDLDELVALGLVSPPEPPPENKPPKKKKAPKPKRWFAPGQPHIFGGTKSLGRPMATPPKLSAVEVASPSPLLPTEMVVAATVPDSNPATTKTMTATADVSAKANQMVDVSHHGDSPKEAIADPNDMYGTSISPQPLILGAHKGISVDKDNVKSNETIAAADFHQTQRKSLTSRTVAVTEGSLEGPKATREVPQEGVPDVQKDGPNEANADGPDATTTEDMVQNEMSDIQMDGQSRLNAESHQATTSNGICQEEVSHNQKGDPTDGPDATTSQGNTHGEVSRIQGGGPDQSDTDGPGITTSEGVDHEDVSKIQEGDPSRSDTDSHEAIHSQKDDPSPPNKNDSAIPPLGDLQGPTQESAQDPKVPHDTCSSTESVLATSEHSSTKVGPMESVSNGETRSTAASAQEPGALEACSKSSEECYSKHDMMSLKTNGGGDKDKQPTEESSEGGQEIFYCI